MKFIKSSFAQKLIIILIAIMIFNIAVPKQVSAWDVGGVLLKPIFSLVLVLVGAVDATIGVFLVGGSMALDALGDVTEKLTGNESTTIKDTSGNDIGPADFLVGPDTIFSNKVKILDANIFKASTSNGMASAADMVGTVKKSIAGVYVLLRNICALIMLAGLIFTGIRILVSSNIPTKMAQWKAYLQDWLIGLVLLIFSHIIMNGIFFVSDTLTGVLGSTMVGTGMNWAIFKKCLGSWEAASQIICIIMLIYLIYLTIVFAIAYFKRLMWICVLIILAPIVSVMYSFGGNTKGIYTNWLREYITTVLVQPFHMIIYSTLVLIPLNLTGTTSGFNVDSTFELIYALGAMSFIRPAEKYIRGLFGMDKGLANMASFDSGKQVLDAVADTAKQLASVAAVVATGGAAAPIKEAAMSGKSVAMGGEAIAAGEMDFGLLESGIPREEIYGDVARDPFHDDFFSGDQFYDNNLQNQDFAENSLMNENELQGFLDELGLEKGSIERVDMETSLREQGHGLKEEDSSNKTEGIPQKAIEDKHNNGNNINASNVTITAGNVNMQGDIENVGTDTTEKAVEKLEDEKDTSEDDKAGNNDGNVSIKSPGKDEEETGNIRRGTALGNFLWVATGQKGIFETLSERPKSKTARKIQDKIRDKALNAKTLPGKHIGHYGMLLSGQGMETKLGKKLLAFEQAGGMQKLHEGFNKVRDSFYANGAPQDWKATNARMSDRQKERLEQQKFEFSNLNENQWLVDIYEAKLRDQYPDRTRYSDAYILNAAREKAESKLKSLADTYVPLGLTDAKLAYECDEDRKQYGLTAEGAVKERIDFEKFNINQENLSYINKYYSTNATSVTEAIPPAREYYNNGYKNVGDMNLVKELTTVLNVSMNKGMQLDQVLRKKGGEIKIDYGKAGISGKQKENLDKIINQYKEIQRDKK